MKNTFRHDPFFSLPRVASLANLAVFMALMTVALSACVTVTSNKNNGAAGRPVDAKKVLANQTQIQNIIQRHMPEIKQCYFNGLTKDPSVQGKLVIQWSIGPKGHVYAAEAKSSTLRSPEVENCALAHLRLWKFPEPVGHEWQVVSYPFILRR